MHSIPFFIEISQIIMDKELKSDRGGSYVIIEKADADYKQLEWNELIGCLKNIEKHRFISCSHLSLPNIKDDMPIVPFILNS